jgi:hypothetical protein
VEESGAPAETVAPVLSLLDRSVGEAVRRAVPLRTATRRQKGHLAEQARRDHRWTSRAGEEGLNGLQEVEEELGLTVVTDELVPLGTRRAERGIPAGLDCEFQEVFLLVRSLAPEELPL